MKRHIFNAIFISLLTLCLAIISIQQVHADTLYGYVDGNELYHPVPYAQVYSFTDSRYTEADFDGYYQLDNLTSGWHDIQVYAPGYETLRTQVYVSDVTYQDFLLIPAGGWGTVQGSITRCDDHSGIGYAYIEVDTGEYTYTDASGNFDLQLPYGTYFYYIWAGDDLEFYGEFTLESSSLDLGEICLSPLDYVTGTVLDSQSGAPVSGANISYNGAVQATTLANGSFTLCVPSGTQNITISAPGYLTKQTSVSVPSQNVIIAIDPVGSADDHCNQAGDCATDLQINGDLLPGAFETPADVDYFKFYAINTVQYVIETSNLGSGCDTVLYLYDSDGTTLIASNDDGGLGLASKITWSAAASALVYVKVEHYDSTNATGTYQIGVQGSDDHCNTADTCATEIPTNWTPVNGRIETAGDVDYFRFSATAGMTYTVETQVTGSSDTVIVLYGPDGSSVVAEDDDGGEGLGSRISWVANSAGTYYIEVRQYSQTATGAYQLRVKGTDDHCSIMTSCATYLIPHDTPTPGVFEFDNDEDWFQFEALGGVTYSIETSNLAGGCDTYLYLYDANGTLLAFDDDGGNEAWASLIEWYFDTTGTYYVLAKHYSPSGRGSYDISVSIPGAEVQVLTPGEAPVYDSIDADDDVGIFLFYAEIDKTYSLETSNLAGGCDTVIRLYAPDGVTLLAEDDDGGDEDLASKITFTGTITGLHYVLVYHYDNLPEPDGSGVGGGRGSYDISLIEEAVDDHSNEYSQATVLPTGGTPLDGRFESPGDQDWFKFTASAGTRYIIETGYLGDGCDTVMELYDTDGATLITFDDDGGNEDLASLIDWTANSSGTYYVRLRHYSTSGTGAYKICLQTLATDDHSDTSEGATSIVIDAAGVAGRIDVADDVDWFSFNAEADHLYIIETSNLDAQCDTIIQLIDPNVTEIIQFNDDGGEDLASRIVWSADGSGTYFVRVFHYDPFGTGAYEISIQDITEQAACTTVNANGSIAGTLAQTGEGKLYCITLAQGDRIDVTLDGPASGADFDLYLSMDYPPSLDHYDARGFTTSADEFLAFTFPQTGKLYIWVRSYSGTGNFTLSNTVTPYVAPDCEQIGENTPATGSLSNAGDSDLYCIDVNAGDHLLVQLDGPDSGADFDLYLKLGAPPTVTDYDARGYSSLADEVAALDQLDAGRVYIRVLSYSGQGSYSLSAQIAETQPDCIPLSGDPASDSGHLNFSTDFMLFCYQTNGNAVDITLSGPANTDFDLFVKFGSPPTLSDYDAVSAGTTSQESIHFAASDGTLYIMVNSYYGQGDFSIQVTVNEGLSESMRKLSSSDPSQQIMYVKGQFVDKTSGLGLQPNTFCINIKYLGKYCYSSETSQIVYLPGGYFFFIAPKMISPITCTLSDIPCYKSIERDFNETTISSILFEVEVNETADCDNDGMLAYWEKQYGLDIWKNDAQLDLDQDGYSNLEEYNANTNPNNKDSIPSGSKAPVVTGLANDPGPVASKTWNWGADEPATFRYVIDTNPNGVPTGNYTAVQTATQSSGSGIYYIHVQAKDADGNESAIVTVSVLIDNKPPVITGLTNDPGPVASKTWNWGADEPATFRYVIDTNPNGVPTGNYSSVTTATQNSGSGTYYIHVQARDAAGNESAIVTVSVFLGNKPKALPWLPLLLDD